jgi:hypothetical protein
MVKIAAVVTAFVTLVGMGIAVALTGRGSGEALAQVGAASSTLLAWTAGILVAVPASVHAFLDDRKNGIRALLRARGASSTAYAQGRILGLAIVLFVVVGGGTLLSGGAAFLLASRMGVAVHAFGTLVASLVYSAAYALVVAPLALAALGGRFRSGGYLRLVALLVVPELLQPWTSGLVPAGWGGVLSVPSALGALRASLLPGLDGAMLARSAVVLAGFAALSYAFVLAEIAAMDVEPTDPDGAAPGAPLS